MRKLLSPLLLSTVLLIVPGVSPALTSAPGDAQAAPAGNGEQLGDPVLLSKLVAGATIQVGDKRFDSFTYSFTGDMPSADNVNVIPIMDDGGNFGIRFQGAFIDIVSSSGGSDALIGYTVTVLDPELSIVGAHLAGNPTRLSDFGSISVTETVDFDPELRLTIFDDESAGRKSVDWAVFPPVTSISVLKDILALAVVEGSSGEGTVTLSFVDQTFEQQPAPEPAAALLLGAGVLALLALRRQA